jgi:glycosyltransferase involved in cell wall biosynthesis
MFWSTIIATIGRPSLARSVESVLSQHASPAEFEVIVVNDSGRQLEPAEWQSSKQVTVLQTNRQERCIARNTGAAIARGTYLHFLDDDDWLLPSAIQALSNAARASNAAWIYGASRLVDKNENLMAEHHIGVEGNAFVQVMAGEWLPLQASIIKASCFFEAGGFNPRINVCEDKDICRRVALRGNLVMISAPVVCILRDRSQSTADYGLANTNSILSRNNILNMQGAFARMWESANSAYWRGRMTRAYLTCAIWSFRNGTLIHGLNRTGQAAAGFIRSSIDLLSPAFWRALALPHTRKNVF